MSGRITSESAPARNAHGVPYKQLLEMEIERNKRIEAKLREAHEAMIEAEKLPSNSYQRREAMVAARLLREAALS